MSFINPSSASKQCYHCGADVPTASDFFTTINDVKQPMCCIGCQTVAQIIVDNGLNNFYDYRGEELNTLAFSINEKSEIEDSLKIYDLADVQTDFVSVNDQQEASATLVIEGISCAACVWLLDKHINNQPGVINFNVNLTTHRATLRWHINTTPLSQLLFAFIEIGYKAHPYHPDKQEALLNQEKRQYIIRLGISGIGSMQTMMFAAAIYAAELTTGGMEEKYLMIMRWSSLLIATPVVLYAAYPFLRNAIRDIKAKHLSMDIPVSIAIWGGFFASAWATIHNTGETYFESVSMFTFFLLIGRFMEMKARQQNSKAGNALLNLIPDSALLVDANKELIQVPVSRLKPGDTIQVKSGETLPADGVLLSQYTSVDESALTGEYLPISKKYLDPLTGGSINIENPIELQVTAVGEQSQLSAIVRLLDRAQSEKPSVAKIADRVARYFVGATLIVACCVFTLWYMHEPSKAFWVTLSVLVVTCPCALSLATPTALTAATSVLRQKGLLITRGNTLEALSQATHMVFDKTGTLTEGRLALAAMHQLTRQDRETLLQQAAALENMTEHPISCAFKPWFSYPASEVSHHIGLGVEGVIAAQKFRIGKPDFAMALKNNAIPAWPDEDGHWLLLANEQQALAWFSVTDELRKEAHSAIAMLQRLGITTHILSGDTSKAVEEVAAYLNMDHFEKGMTPADKLTAIQTLQNSGSQVIMIGDGINDLPVIVGAQTSISMGRASDLAKTKADAVLTSNNLSTLTYAVQLARKTRQIIKQNLALSLTYNVIALPAAAMGLIPPYIAALGMTASSIIVTGNAMRLLRFEPTHHKSVSSHVTKNSAKLAPLTEN